MSNRSLPTVLIIAAITGTIFGFIAFGYAIPNASSQESDNGVTRTIKVSGDASWSLESDQVVILLSLQSKPGDAKTVIAAQQQAIEKVKQALEFVDISNSSSVKVGSLTLNPSYDFGQNFGVVPAPSNGSYTLDANVPVKVTLDQLPDVAELLGEAGYSTGDVYNHYECQDFDDETGECVGPVEYFSNLNVVISIESGPLQDVVTEYQEKSKDLESMLEEFGVASEDIGPDEINIQPEGARSQPSPFSTGQITSYQAFTQITVTTSLENMDRVVAVAQEEGAIPQSVILSVSDSKMEEARRELTLEALDNARSRASDIAESLGKEIKDVISVDVVTNAPASPYGSYFDPLQVAFSRYLPSQGTEITITVAAEFEIG
jgi:uncharacterized protein YggE